MLVNTIQRKGLKKILKLLVNVSDENLNKILEIGEKVFIRDGASKATMAKASTIKEAFKKKHPALDLVRNTFNRCSPNCREKALENFIINSGILGTKKREALRKTLGIGIPWFFVISPTAKCNLHCTGCYAYEYAKDINLSFKEVDRVLAEAKELGIYFITISGGEPFLWEPLFTILEKHSDMYFQIYTNGILIDGDVAEKLAEVGNAAPGISIEGFEKETDERRGRGTYQKVLTAMDNLNQAGVIFGFSVTPTNLTSDIVMSDEFIDLMIEKGCSFGWYFQYVPIGGKPDVSLMSTPEQRNNLRVRVGEIMHTKPIFIGDFWNHGPQVGGCIAAARRGGYFHINCNGDVEPCVFLQFFVDNIKGKKLIDVIQSPFFKAIQDEQPYSDNQNLLMPCALIDNPWVLRKVVDEFHAKPSYNGSKDVISDPQITEFLDNYSREYRKITDPIWENELRHKYPCWRDRFN